MSSSSSQVQGRETQQVHHSSPHYVQTVQPVMVAPPPTAFYSQGQGIPRVMAPQVMLGPPVLYYQSPRFEYKPNDFLITTILTIIVCGCFSPLSLMLSLPALYYAIQSSKSAKANSIKLARSQGMIAAYLNATAVVFALVVTFVVSPVIIAVVVPNDLDSCISTVEDRYDGEIPTRISTWINETYISYDLSC